MNRRVLLISAAAAGVSACAHAKPLDRSKDFAAIEAQLKGRLGVSAIDTGDGRELLYRADERFAMASTFKLALAAAVLAKVDQGALSRDQMVPYTSADLFDYAPVTRAHVAKGALSIEALCAAVVEVSDNSAANLLLPLVGGPEGFMAFLRAHGDKTTRLDRTEPTLNTNLPGDPRDTTTPNAMRETVRTLALGAALSPASRASLEAWMVNSTTGLNRLRGGFPKEWRVGDKTGNGGNGATNDLAIAWPPHRKPIVIAVYSSNTDAAARELAFADIARLIARTFT